MKRILLLSILLISLVIPLASVEAARYKPQQHVSNVERYEIIMNVYFLEKWAFKDAVKFYFGPANHSDICAFVVSDAEEKWIDLYMPKTDANKIDIIILGHEFGHVLDFTNLIDKLGYSLLDPDYAYGAGRLILPDDTVVEFRLKEHAVRERLMP